jgi:hypothetical protein
MFVMDIHTHTAAYSPCSISDPLVHIERASTIGLGGICITEHDRLWPEYEWKALERDARRLGLLLLPGQEIRCYDANGEIRGDFLVFGPEILIDRPLFPTELITLIHEKKGIVIAAHPYRTWCSYLGAGDLVYDLALDALELFHPQHNQTSVEKARKAIQTLNIASTSASDAHRPEEIGTFGTIFPEPVTRLEDLVTQIKGRLSIPTSMLPGWPEEG